MFEISVNKEFEKLGQCRVRENILAAVGRTERKEETDGNCGTYALSTLGPSS